MTKIIANMQLAGLSPKIDNLFYSNVNGRAAIVRKFESVRIFMLSVLTMSLTNEFTGD